MPAACRREAPPSEAQNDAEIAVPVAAQPARRGSLRAIIRTTGVVTPAAGAEFMATAPEPARIVEIPPAEGDRVARGDVLVRFDVPSAAAEAARHAADIARAQALLENARVAQTRARELVERGIISRREMENADRELADAQADLARAEAAQRTSEAAAARAIVRAPFAGLIAQRLHNPGDVVQGVATDPILRLVDPDRLEVMAPIPAADAPRVLPGAAARVTSVPEPIRLIVTTRAIATAAWRGRDRAADVRARCGDACRYARRHRNRRRRTRRRRARSRGCDSPHRLHRPPCWSLPATGPNAASSQLGLPIPTLWKSCQEWKPGSL